MNGRNDLQAIASRFKATTSPFRAFLSDLHEKYSPLSEGVVADYIPELAKADPNWFSICVVTVDGQVYEVGDFAQLCALETTYVKDILSVMCTCGMYNCR